MARIIIVWGAWGPYHCRRFEVLRGHAARQGHQVSGISLFSGSSVNQWRVAHLPEGVVHFDLGRDETRFPWAKLVRLLAIPTKTKADVALLPSYDHWSLALNLAVRFAGGRTVMMNDSHGGTARARGLKAAFKKQVVSGFHAGFVAGAPHARYFAALGLPGHKILTGYDAVDNDFFAQKAAAVRSDAAAMRKKYALPENYFLSLGRFVPKKNLATLIRGYRKFLKASRADQTHLVMVGSGDEQPRLRALCQELRLPVYDKTTAGAGDRASRSEVQPPGVHFYGFRQIDENPVFYALADAFVLPSLWEEWGLVVNEAMASGLPVVVSETAGCAEDLLEPGCPAAAPAEERVRLRQSGLALKVRANGFVFSPESAEELGRTLLALESSKDLRAMMGRDSMRIAGKFSCENFARNAICAVDAALDKPVPAGALVPPETPRFT